MHSDYNRRIRGTAQGDAKVLNQTPDRGDGEPGRESYELQQSVDLLGRLSFCFLGHSIRQFREWEHNKEEPLCQSINRALPPNIREVVSTKKSKIKY